VIIVLCFNCEISMCLNLCMIIAIAFCYGVTDFNEMMYQLQCVCVLNVNL